MRKLETKLCSHGASQENICTGFGAGNSDRLPLYHEKTLIKKS